MSPLPWFWLNLVFCVVLGIGLCYYLNWWVLLRLMLVLSLFTEYMFAFYIICLLPIIDIISFGFVI